MIIEYYTLMYHKNIFFQNIVGNLEENLYEVKRYVFVYINKEINKLEMTNMVSVAII